MDLISYNNINNITILDFLNSFHLSKSNIYHIQSLGLLKVNGKDFNFNYIIKPEDNVTINIEHFESNQIVPWEFDLNIIYEDEDILIINKPIKILIHPDGNDNHTLANAVSYYYNSKNIKRQVRPVHRLDYDTSGVIVFAKHLLAHSFINYQIENNLFKKTYYAIINGEMREDVGTISLNIGRDRHNSNRYIVHEKGKNAITHYQTIKKKNGNSLIKICIETGRTHQIRVHFSYLNHPLIGDKIYGKNSNRLMLHAYEIKFIHPRTFKEIKFTAPLPRDFVL